MDPSIAQILSGHCLAYASIDRYPTASVAYRPPPRIVSSAAVLQPDVLFEGRDVFRRGQQEQVSDPTQADLLSGSLLEPGEGLETASTQLDIQLIGKLSSNAPRCLACRTGAQLSTLEQNHIGDPGLGEMERDAGTDHAPTDDHDRSAGSH